MHSRRLAHKRVGGVCVGGGGCFQFSQVVILENVRTTRDGTYYLDGVRILETRRIVKPHRTVKTRIMCTTAGRSNVHTMPPRWTDGYFQFIVILRRNARQTSIYISYGVCLQFTRNIIRYVLTKWGSSSVGRGGASMYQRIAVNKRSRRPA